MSNRDNFIEVESVDGHRWGRFTPTSVIGGKDWEVCFAKGTRPMADYRRLIKAAKGK